MKKENVIVTLLAVITALLFVIVSLLIQLLPEKNTKCDWFYEYRCVNAYDLPYQKPSTGIKEEGKITNITINGDYGIILVESNTSKTSVRITENTTISFIDKVSASSGSAKFSDFEVGLLVEVIYDGPIAESYPGQGTAKSVTILKA